MENNSEELYLENQLCFPLYATSRLTTKIYSPFLNDLGVTYPQYLVLLTLWQLDGQTVNSIGEHLYLESNTLTPLLKRLEKKNLIKRTRSQKDERTVVISLTSKGNKLKVKAKEIPRKIVQSFNDTTLSEKEIINFHNTLYKLLNVLNNRTKQGKDYK